MSCVDSKNGSSINKRVVYTHNRQPKSNKSSLVLTKSIKKLDSRATGIMIQSKK